MYTQGTAHKSICAQHRYNFKILKTYTVWSHCMQPGETKEALKASTNNAIAFDQKKKSSDLVASLSNFAIWTTYKES